MRHILLFSLFVPILVFGQTNGIVKAKLVDYSADKIPAYCGHLAFATTLKFELYQDYGTLKKGTEFLVIIACPRAFGIENYMNNHVYTLTIYGDSDEDRKHKNYGWSIWCTYENEKLPTVWLKELIK